MNNKLFIICGKSGSGKSTIESEIHKLGLANKVISTTTRKKRSYEQDHVDYHFISELVFKTYLNQEQYAEWSTYPTINGDAYYGINKNDIKLKESNHVCVVNPKGMRQLIDNLGKENIVTIYINRSDKDRVISSLQRDNSDFIKVLEEVVRRFKADDVDFCKIQDEVDYVINNDEDIEEAVNQFVKIMVKEGVRIC